MTSAERDPNRELETEIGLLRLELKPLRQGMEEMIAAADLSDEIKRQCMDWVEVTYRDLDKEKDDVHPSDFSRSRVSTLITLLDTKDKEQKALFEGLRDSLLEARDSALGWQKR